MRELQYGYRNPGFAYTASKMPVTRGLNGTFNTTTGPPELWDHGQRPRVNKSPDSPARSAGAYAK